MFKRKADSSIKGRVVAQGWNQDLGLDCGSTYASVCRTQSVRVVACITVEFNVIFDQMDVSTAFLYADIQEQVFVKQSPGFEVKDKDGGDMVMQKSLYGLAQSPGNWFKTIDPRACRDWLRRTHVRPVRVFVRSQRRQDLLYSLRR